MDRKHRRHKRAAPQKPCHPPQDQEKQDHRRCVEQDIGKMMAAGVQSVKLAVQHMGKPGQRVPVEAVDMGKRPAKSLPGQTLLNDRVLIHIHVVVVSDKVVPQRLAEDQPDNGCQENADPRNRPAAIQTSRTAFGFRRAGVCHSRHFTDRRNRRA